MTKKYSTYNCSDALLFPLFRRLLGHTDHGDSYKSIFDIRLSRSFFLLPLVFLDLILAKVFSRSLITTFDINFIKCKPVFLDLLFVGYFQGEVSFSDYIQGYVPTHVPTLDGSKWDAVIHVRGGDFLSGGIATEAVFYRRVVKHLRLEYGYQSFLVVTDDVDYAKEVFNSDEGIEYRSGNVLDDLSLLSSATTLVTSFSTFSLFSAAISESIHTLIVHPQLQNTFFDFKNKKGVNVMVFSEEETVGA